MLYIYLLFHNLYYQLLTWGHFAIWGQSVLFGHKWKIVCRVGTCVCSFCSCKHWLTTHSSKHNIKCTFPLSKNCLGWVVAALLRQVCRGPGGLCSPWCGGPPQQSNHISIFSPYKYEKIQICIYIYGFFEGRVAGKECRWKSRKKEEERRPCKFIIMVPLFPPT